MLTIYIPIKVLIIFLLIVLVLAIVGLISDIKNLIEKKKGDNNACKEKKES